MIKRQITSQINRLKKGFPVIAVTGPRQSGKTTLIKNIFPKYTYFNLENPETLNMVENDPAGFINTNNHKIIIDEVQKVPQLLSYIQSTVDEQKTMGNFIINGSENLLLSQKINQSLAGRAAYINLLPLSNQELSQNKLPTKNLHQQIFTGFYPAIYDRKIDPIDYYNQYIATYVERDLKQISQINNLSQFRNFLSLLAGRIGQLVNLSSLANDIGVAVNTIENWISILEASYLAFRLQPYYKNFGKRHIKSPKIYFTDVGLACRLLTLTKPLDLKSHFLIGGLFENLVITEIKKYIINNSKSSTLYFYRDSNHNEIDLIIDTGNTQIPVEIKSSGTFSSQFTSNLKFWQKNSIGAEQKGFIVYTGKQSLVGNHTQLLGWPKLEPLLKLIT